MRAEKRKKNAPRELERLKKILGTKADVVMEEVKEVATVLPAKKVLEQGGELGARWAAPGVRGGLRWQTGPGPGGGRGARAALPEACRCVPGCAVLPPPLPGRVPSVLRTPPVVPAPGQGRPAVYLLLFR